MVGIIRDTFACPICDEFDDTELRYRVYGPRAYELYKRRKSTFYKGKEGE